MADPWGESCECENKVKKLLLEQKLNMRLHFLPLLLFGIGASCKTLESENEIDIDSFDESDILDVVQNFIAEKDPILEVGSILLTPI